jgi:hypothetical protein
MRIRASPPKSRTSIPRWRKPAKPIDPEPTANSRLVDLDGGKPAAISIRRRSLASAVDATRDERMSRAGMSWRTSQRLGGRAPADRASLGGAAARRHRPGRGLPPQRRVHQAPWTWSRSACWRPRKPRTSTPWRPLPRPADSQPGHGHHDHLEVEEMMGSRRVARRTSRRVARRR